MVESIHPASLFVNLAALSFFIYQKRYKRLKDTSVGLSLAHGRVARYLDVDADGLF